jgi:hypothetical protein
MSIPSPLSTLMIADQIIVDTSRKLQRMEVEAKDLTPPPSPSPMKTSPTLLKESPTLMKGAAVLKTNGVVAKTGDAVETGKWLWWQGYRKDRRVLGFEATPGKNAALVTKRGPRKKKKDDD